jgi:hypothetical protein
MDYSKLAIPHDEPNPLHIWLKIAITIVTMAKVGQFQANP